MRAATTSLTAFKIAVAGGGAAFAGAQTVVIHGQAHAAACLAPLEPGLDENFVQPLSLGLLLDGTVSACCAAHVPIGNLFERPLSTMLTERLDDHPDCFGCSRYEVVKSLSLFGTPV